MWAIRARLKLADDLRDLALFNAAIESSGTAVPEPPSLANLI
jgi:hypothetical protein